MQLSKDMKEKRVIITRYFEAEGSGGTTTPPVINPLNVTANGTYNVDSGVDGFNPVVVKVPDPTPKFRSYNRTEQGEIRASCIHNDVFYGAGYNSQNMTIFDCITETASEVSLGSSRVRNSINAWKDNLYITSNQANIEIINTQTKVVRTVNIPFTSTTFSIIYRDALYIFAPNSNLCCIFDLNTETYRMMVLLASANRFCGVVWRGNLYVHRSDTNIIDIIDLTTEKTRIVTLAAASRSNGNNIMALFHDKILIGSGVQGTGWYVVFNLLDETSINTNLQYPFIYGLQIFRNDALIYNHSGKEIIFFSMLDYTYRTYNLDVLSNLFAYNWLRWRDKMIVPESKDIGAKIYVIDLQVQLFR